jgi:phosphopantothenoylcysteine decarboxylase / phosphopantothenate---cysteine ligase
MGHFLQGKNVTLGVTGGIAAYKSIELLRLLTKAGARVRVIMTENACWFVAPGTFQTLSGQPVCTSVFDEGDAAIRHIDWAQSTDLAVIAPATANCIGKLAGGIADDALSTYMLAVTAPVVICPAMNTNMYQHPSVQRNLDILRGYGHFLIEPHDGQLACGTEGPGRLPEPAFIMEKLAAVMTPDDFAGQTVLITAGPTREAIDPVRFISNPSSGKMGFAIANAARQRGARVKLVCGPVDLSDPVDVDVHRVTSAREMYDRVMQLMDDVDIVIKTAAVSDYRPASPAEHKIKKTTDQLTLELEKTQDILHAIGQQKGNRIVIGFAAETQDLKKNAAQKLKAKNLDLIVGNVIGDKGAGFAGDTNRVTFFYPDGTAEPMDVMTKEKVAHGLLDRIAALKTSKPKP